MNIQKSFLGIALLIFFFFAFGLWNTPGAKAQTVDGAAVSISADQASFGASEAVILHVTISNPTADALRVLDWMTPINGGEKPLFTLTRDGAPVAYLGKLVKYATPSEQDYIILAAGESVVRDVDVSAYYNLTTSGSYVLTYQVGSSAMYASYSGANLVRSAGSLLSNSLTLSIASHATLPKKKIIGDAVTGGTTFNSCTVTRQTALINARNAASIYASDSVAYFTANKQGARYTTWFGTWNGTRYNTVINQYTALQTAIDTANPMAFDCTCTDPNTYAYVYPNSPYNVYLCGAFWAAPMTGTDSKAGTLIHETSHFTVVAGTDDYAYGQTAAKALAINNPAQAIMNADSHEYFSENNPPLELDPTSTPGPSPTPTLTITPNGSETATPTVTMTPTTTATPSATSITVYAVGAQDGWVLETSENSNTGGAINTTGATILLGDDMSKKQYRSLLSFNTGSLPDTAVITGVTLKLKKQSILGGGNPITSFGGFFTDIKTGYFGTSASLQTSDFQVATSKTYGPFSPTLTGGWYTVSLTGGKAYINKLAGGSGLTQIRLRFKLDDNNNALANILSLYSGNAPAASRPQLVISYYVP